MAEHTDNWGALAEVLREMGPAGSLLGETAVSAKGTRAYLRWMFGALESFTFCLKRIVMDHVERSRVELSRREREVLDMIKEPAFPGLPPPRRIEAPMRETLGVAVNVYARVRGKTSPLPDGRLPEIFIQASVLHDRIAHPESPEDLDITKVDIKMILELLRWFETVRGWLYQDRAAEIAEMKAKIEKDSDELLRKLTASTTAPRRPSV
ncbi:MAG: hypothetical protein ACXW5U_24995 [Thermoanaerobaculia bacterium]